MTRREWLRRRWWVIPAALAVAAYFTWFTVSAVEEARDRRAARDNIEALALDIKAIASDLSAQGDRIEEATSEEARTAGNARLAFAVGELRRSQDCVGFYFNGERGHPACTEVDRRLDAIAAGADPFPPPPPG